MTNPDQPQSKEPGQQVLERLRDLERRPVEALVLYQARRLETLLRHARQTVPFYKDRLDAVFDADGTLDLSRWQDVPVLARQEAQEHAEHLKATMIPADAGNALPDRTMGSGGSPFHFIRSLAAVAADAGNTLRIYLDHGFDLNARLCDIRLDVSGNSSWPEGSTRKAWTHGEGTGDYALLDINTDTDKQVEWLLRCQPRSLFTWATNARRIALELERTGRSIPLTSIATSAEPCSQAVHDDLRRVFGLDPVDILGAREIGIVAFPCNHSPLHHFAAESAFLEVITDEGKPAGPGETGRIVATGFYNFHMPFIRYDLGDYVTLNDRPCGCGRSLPAISKIHGRARARFSTAGGRKIFPDVPEAELDAVMKPCAWQIAQTGIGALEIRVDGLDLRQVEAQRPRLAEILETGLDEPVSFTIVEKSLQPGPGRRKHESFRNEIG